MILIKIWGYVRWYVVLVVQSLNHVQLFARLPCPSLSPWVCPNSCPLSLWYHPTILPSIVPFSSCPQSSPASGSFPVSQFIASGGQSTEASASTTVLPMNIHGWFPLGLTGLISLLSKGLSGVFSDTIWKHQFFGTQPSLWSKSQIRIKLQFILSGMEVPNPNR